MVGDGDATRSVSLWSEDELAAACCGADDAQRGGTADESVRNILFFFSFYFLKFIFLATVIFFPLRVPRQ